MKELFEDDDLFISRRKERDIKCSDPQRFKYVLIENAEIDLS